MVFSVTIERDDDNIISDLTIYKPDGDVLHGFYGVTDMIVDSMKNDRERWSLDNPMFQNNVFLIYETPKYTDFAELKHKKEDAIYNGTGLELLRELRKRNYD